MPNAEREHLIDSLLGIKRNLLQMTSAIESPVDSLSERKVAAGD